MPSTNLSNTPQAPQLLNFPRSFYQFPLLPLEIQLRIWVLASHQTHPIIHYIKTIYATIPTTSSSSSPSHHQQTTTSQPPKFTSTQPPAPSSKPAPSPAPPNHTTTPSIPAYSTYINPLLDILYNPSLTSHPWDTPPSLSALTNFLPCLYTPLIRRLAINVSTSSPIGRICTFLHKSENARWREMIFFVFGGWGREGVLREGREMRVSVVKGEREMDWVPRRPGRGRSRGETNEVVEGGRYEGVGSVGEGLVFGVSYW